MKKLKKIKLNIEKDIISSISKEDQIEIKGGYEGGGTGGNGITFGCYTNTCGVGPFQTNANPCYSPGTNSCNCGTNDCKTNTCYTVNYTDRCAPTGSAMSQGMEYNCYTFHTMCNC